MVLSSLGFPNSSDTCSFKFKVRCANSWLNFGIWILGGALWGVLFGLLMNLFMGKDNDALNMKGQRKVLNKGLNQLEHGDLFEGTIYYETSNKWTGKYIQAAAMEVKDKEAILYFMKKKNVVDIHASLESICKDLYFSDVKNISKPNKNPPNI